MPSASLNYGLNLLYLLRKNDLLRHGRLPRPLVVTYFLTTHCNLNCGYCEDFGARRNGQNVAPPPLEDALAILRTIRTGTDAVILTGGEPLLHPQIDALVERAKRELRFGSITMLTNAALLHNHEAVLPHLNRLVISLDSTDAALWSSIVNVPRHTVDRIFENITTYAAKQKQYGYRMVLNCVVTPQTLPGARSVIDFCERHGILVSFSPQAVMNWPSYDLLVSEEYKTFLAELLERKARGAPVLGSRAYLRTLLDFRPYACYPMLNPRVMPSGELLYPCRPIEKENNGHGGRPCNLRDVRDWNEAVTRAVAEHGSPPQMCTSCFQQCYAEASLMQARPLDWIAEWLRYPASRTGDLPTFAPG